ncbi:MAG: carboxymuconolactone decarboxylase family protein [Gammaproteobacteria bacterium]
MKYSQKGAELMIDIFGEEATDHVHKQLGEIYPPFLDFLTSTVDDLYSDTTLDIKTKEIIVLASLITQKDTKPQIKTHLKAALRAGVTPKEVLAMILHLTMYVGFPATLNAVNIAKETFEEMGVGV